MAYIRVKKSDSAYTDIPLTEDKAIPPSVEVYSGGKFYYNPLVTSDDYLNSGVRVNRYGGEDYCALATQIYDPITHDKSGASWGAVSGTPEITQRGRLHIPSGAYLLQEQTITLSASSYFWISFSFALDSVIRNSSQGIFAISNASDTSNYWNFSVDNNSNFYSNHNSRTLAKWGDNQVSAGKWYEASFRYDNGTFHMSVDGTWKTVSKALNSTSTTYSLNLGYNSKSLTTSGITIGAVQYEYGADVDHTVKGSLTFGNI